MTRRLAALLALSIGLAPAAALPHGVEEHAAPPPGEPLFEPPEPGTYELPPIARVRDYRLLGPDGTPAPLLGLSAGEVAIVSFIYRSCSQADGCPLALATLRRLDREAGLVAPELVDPANLGVEAENLAEDIADANQQDAEDEAVQQRICHEGPRQRVHHHGGHHRDDDEKQHHPREEYLRACHHRALATGGGRRGHRQRLTRRTSTRSGGPPSFRSPSARTSMRVLRTPCSMRIERTASARDSESRRASLALPEAAPA